ncbi:hypothetical protein LVD17_04865 [Fulvivirga ulvae]|uniref:hypothetical protein n=1 Tax=Fulvivirga ulvae TaxID=2904245 RepID=UPI001F463336|nr:hypothetical protein [Fulvivirga ulvae]UII33157.1 hypothetical protein LVD17_04865 [Fulvivirga ulvae]
MNKKNIPSIVGVVIGAVAFFLVYNYFFAGPSTDEILQHAAAKVNEQCPMLIDDQTRLDSATALPDNNFQYRYTLSNIDKSNTDLAVLEENLKAMIIEAIKNNPDMTTFKELGTTIQYYYEGSDGEQLFNIVITEDMW